MQMQMQMQMAPAHARSPAVIEAGVSPIVVIAPDDVGFTSDHCGTWELGPGA